MLSGNMKMTLLRFSLWTLLILALIPTSEGNRYSIYKIVTGAVQDLDDFCTRTPETCQQTQNALFSLKDKANYLGSAIFEVFSSSSLKTATIDNLEKNEKQTLNSDKLNNNISGHATNVDKKLSYNKKAAFYQSKIPASQDTLAPSDRDAEWLAPNNRNIASNDI